MNKNRQNQRLVIFFILFFSTCFGAPFHSRRLSTDLITEKLITAQISSINPPISQPLAGNKHCSALFSFVYILYCDAEHPCNQPFSSLRPFLTHLQYGRFVRSFLVIANDYLIHYFLYFSNCEANRYLIHNFNVSDCEENHYNLLFSDFKDFLSLNLLLKILTYILASSH